VPYEAASRAAGVSKYSLRKMVQLAIDGALSFSTMPIRLATKVGMAIVAFGLLYFLYIVGRYFLYHDLVQGWASVMCFLAILGGVQVMFIGLIGEYIGRIYEESKRRPLYFIKYRTPRRRRGRRQRVTSSLIIGADDATAQH
jgi:dolichol-phosphate mannosyltransferase